MKLQRFIMVSGGEERNHMPVLVPYNGGMNSDVEKYFIATIGMVYDVQQVDIEVARLEAKVERMREALQFFATGQHIASVVSAEDAKEIARKALGDGK